MNFRVIIFLLNTFVWLLTVGSLKANQQQPPFDTTSWETISPTQKYNSIIDWIEKSSNRIRYSHQARMAFATSAYEHAILLQNEELKMSAMHSLAELLINEALFERALLYLDTLSQYAIETQNHILSIQVDNSLSSIHRHRGNVFEALGLAYDAYWKAKSNKYHSLIALSANNLGVSYRSLGEGKIAINYYKEAVEMGLLAKDTNQLITSYSGMGNYYRDEKDAVAALEYYQTAMQLARQSKDLQHIASLNNNIGNTYRDKDDFDNAMYYYNVAYELLEQINVVGLKAALLRNIGLVHHKKAEYSNALEFIHQSLEITTEIGIKTFTRDNYLSLSQIYHSIGNLSEAYNYLLHYNELNQQIHNSQLLNRISYFNEKIFDAQRMEERYKFRFQRNIFILAIVVLFLVFLSLSLVLFLRRFKERRKQYNRTKNALQDKIITEKALRQSEENYQTLIKTLNEGLIVLDQDNKIEFLNIKASKILGSIDKDELKGKPFEKFLLTPDDEKLFQEKVELQKMGISDHYEIKMKNVAGDVLWANISSAPILDENLKAKGSVALISDVTEKKKSEQTYSDLTASLNQKIKQLNCLYDITDISGVPGISFDEIIEKSLEIIPVGLRYSHDIGVQIVFGKKVYASKNFVDTDWSYSVPIKVQKKKLGFIKVTYVEEKPNINKDPFHFNEKILLKNISEKFGRIIESKNLEQVLLENQQKLQEVQRIAKIGNWEKDLTTDHCSFSETFFDITVISHERRKFFDYTKMVEIIHPDDKNIFLDFETKLIKDAQDSDVTANYRIITSDGSIKFIFSSGKIVYDDQQQKTGCVFTIQDITEQKYQQELQHHAELALKTSEAKQQVVANMSYEMRTPITGIQGMTDFLLQSGLNTQQMELAKTIKDSSLGLLNSINNILDLQRIEAGKFRLNNSIFSLLQLMEKVTSLFTALTRNKEIDLNIDIQPDIPENIFSDQERLYQILTSLISIITENESKGSIMLRLRQESITDNRMMVMVELIDNFSNIDINEVRAILDPGEGIEDYLLQKKSKLGVELAISRKLIDLLDGRIGVQKNDQNGTTFFFTFFTTIAVEEDNTTAIKRTKENLIQSLKGVKILCVEDQKINQKVISLMLTHAQCKVTMANNGKEAIELMEKNKYDVILLDMVMPVMDGIETLGVIKTNQMIHPPIIALSANVLDEDKDKYFAAGINDFISKPINAEELYGKIVQWHKKPKRKKSVNIK